MWTCPIKGTRPLGQHVEGEKDSAEHVMIVDLERNDLSRVCEPGSVRWPELMVERQLAGVTHLVSTVEGMLRADVGLAELLAATFPGGSVTGAPRSPPLDLIAELEPVGRGASMGALGTVRGNGDLELALTIRTFAVAEGKIHLWVGGGIVWDSDPEDEIEESWTKARPLLAAIGAPVEAVRASEPCSRWRSAAAASSTRRSRCFAPTTRRCCAAAAPSRRSASMAASRSASPSTSTGSPRRPSGSGCRPVNRLELEELARQALDAAAVPDAVLRLYLDADAARRSRSSARSPATTTTLRERGQRLISLRGVRADEPWLLPGVKSTSYAVNMAAEAEARRRGADDARLRRRGRDRAGRADDEHLVAPRPHALHAVARARHPRRRDARRRDRARGRRRLRPSRRARTRSKSSPAAEEAFTSSSVREVMPVIELDGAPIGRGPAADELQAALRHAAEATLRA